MNRFANLGNPIVTTIDSSGGTPVKKEYAPGKDIVPGAKKVADAEQAMVKGVLGLAIDEQDQWYRNGTKMLACGEDQALKLREDFDALPVVREALEQLIATVEGEQRVDYLTKVSDLTLDSQGLLQGANSGLVLSGRALNNLASFGPTTLESNARKNLNLWMAASEKEVQLRTRNPDKNTGIRHCYAAVGKKYSRFDVDQVARELIQIMPKDAHAEVKYDGNRWSIAVELAPQMNIDEIGVGRVFRIGTRIHGADDRTSSVWAEFYAKRIRCINCTTITDKRLVFKRSHRGDLAGLFKEAMGHVQEAMDAFSKQWSAANKQAMLDKATDGRLTPTETFQRLIAHGYLTVPGIKPKDLVGRLMEKFGKEPGDNAAAILNAITRLAHEEARSWKSPWVTESIEAQAGDLLFQNVYTLPALTEKQSERFAK